MADFDPKRSARIDLNKKRQKENKKIDYRSMEIDIDDNDYENNSSYKKNRS